MTGFKGQVFSFKFQAGDAKEVPSEKRRRREISDQFSEEESGERLLPLLLKLTT